MIDEEFELRGRRVWVAGHRGMVGSAIARRLVKEDCEVITVNRQELDLTRQSDVEAWLESEKPNVIFLAAAKVGGILANHQFAAEFLYENLAIEQNVIHTASRVGVEKLMLLGSSCIYPKMASQPIAEDALLSGPLEPSNQWYAVAKIAGLKLCQAYRRQFGCDFISIMPCNLYGPGDNFDLNSSHVMPALIRKCYEAKRQATKQVTIWGSGRPRREFLYVEDLADAAVFLMRMYSDNEHINVGTGSDITICELSHLIADTVGFQGDFVYDTSMPDGTPQKLLNVGRLNSLGWRPSTSLADGIAETIRWFEGNVTS